MFAFFILGSACPISLDYLHLAFVESRLSPHLALMTAIQGYTSSLFEFIYSSPYSV